MVRDFSAADLSEICLALRLSPVAGQRLGVVVGEIVSEIREHLEKPLAERRQQRREQLTAMRRLSRGLYHLATNLRAAPEEARERIGRLLSADLGRFLSTSALDILLGRSVSSEFSQRDLESRSFNMRGGPAHAIEAAMALRRRDAIRGSEHVLLARLLERLQGRIDEELAYESQNHGGAPGNIYRRHAVRRILLSYEELTAKRPTSTPGGRFATLCEGVLTSIGLSTAGLDNVIAREIAIWKSDRPASS